MKENSITLNYKNVHVYLFLERVETSVVLERGGETDAAETDSKVNYYTDP